MLNRWILSRDRKTAAEGAEVTRSGRLFQTRAAATGKARSPTVDSRVRLTISDEDELERSRWRASTSATWQSSSVRYAGADSWRHVYTWGLQILGSCKSPLCVSSLSCRFPNSIRPTTTCCVSLKSPQQAGNSPSTGDLRGNVCNGFWALRYGRRTRERERESLLLVRPR